MRQGWPYALSLGSLFYVTTLAYAASNAIPLVPKNDLLLEKTAITIAYNPTHKQADWVFYPLGQSELVNCYSRGNNFREDTALPNDLRTKNNDYQGSGFDRGHLSPAGDNKRSQQTMDDSFLLSNISPQVPRFNQGIWAKLENLIRAWALQAGELFITTGPVLKEGLTAIGATRISVPEEYYKVIYNPATSQAIAILMPQNALNTIQDYIVTVRDVESLTGLDFLSNIPQENQVESRVDLNAWDFAAKPRYLPCPKQLDFFPFP